MPGGDPEVAREFAREPKTPDFDGLLCIDLGDQFVRTRFEEIRDTGVEIVDVGFGPFDLGVAVEKRFRFHQWPAG